MTNSASMPKHIATTVQADLKTPNSRESGDLNRSPQPGQVTSAWFTNCCNPSIMLSILDLLVTLYVLFLCILNDIVHAGHVVLRCNGMIFLELIGCDPLAYNAERQRRGNRVRFTLLLGAPSFSLNICII
jgi:hypothetical protein